MKLPPTARFAVPAVVFLGCGWIWSSWPSASRDAAGQQTGAKLMAPGIRPADPRTAALAPDDLERPELATEETAGRIDPGRIEETLNQWLRTRPGRPFPDPATLLLRRWIASSPARAAAWAVRLPPGPARAQALDHVGWVWAEADPATAAEWAQALPQSVERDAVFRAVAGEMARTDPPGALQLALELPATPERNALLVQAIRQDAALDPEDALAWVDRVVARAPDLHDRLLADIAIEWAGREPTRAATMLLHETAPGPIQNEAITGIVLRWAQTSPAETAVWVREFPPALQATASANLISIWAQADPVEAGNWLARHAEGPVRDQAIGAYVTALNAQGSTMASDWARAITDPQLRQAALDGLSSRTP